MARTQDLVPEGLHLTRPAPPVRRAALVLLAGSVLVSVVGFADTVVASYLANGLDAVPLSEVGGGTFGIETLAHPPSPTTQVLGALFLLLVPLLSGLGAIAVVLDLVVDGPPGARSDTVLAVVVLSLCVVSFVAYLSVAQLSVWWVD